MDTFIGQVSDAVLWDPKSWSNRSDDHIILHNAVIYVSLANATQ